jgi:hypothetical protein
MFESAEADLNKHKYFLRVKTLYLTRKTLTFLKVGLNVTEPFR